MSLTKSTANNIRVFDGNSLAIFIDATNGELSLRDIYGNKERLDTFITEGIYGRSTGICSIIPIGQDSVSNGDYTTVSGGRNNISEAPMSFIGGGETNKTPLIPYNTIDTESFSLQFLSGNSLFENGYFDSLDTLNEIFLLGDFSEDMSIGDELYSFRFSNGNFNTYKEYGEKDISGLGITITDIVYEGEGEFGVTRITFDKFFEPLYYPITSYPTLTTNRVSIDTSEDEDSFTEDATISESLDSIIFKPLPYITESTNYVIIETTNEDFVGGNATINAPYDTIIFKGDVLENVSIGDELAYFKFDDNTYSFSKENYDVGLGITITDIVYNEDDDTTSITFSTAFEASYVESVAYITESTNYVIIETTNEDFVEENATINAPYDTIIFEGDFSEDVSIGDELVYFEFENNDDIFRRENYDVGLGITITDIVYNEDDDTTSITFNPPFESSYSLAEKIKVGQELTYLRLRNRKNGSSYTVGENFDDGIGIFVTSNVYNEADNSITIGLDSKLQENYYLLDESYKTVINGRCNSANCGMSTIINGCENTVNSMMSTIGNGCCNTITEGSVYSTIGGGRANYTACDCASVLNGSNNCVFGRASTILNGQGNDIFDNCGTIAGGSNNVISTGGSEGFIGSGNNNTVSCRHGFVGSGFLNRAMGCISFVGTGCYHCASGCYSFVGNGRCNRATGLSSLILNGCCNCATNTYSNVINGCCNCATSNNSTIVNGNFNRANGSCSFVGNGTSNCASSGCSTVVNGVINCASNSYSFVGNGFSNRASGGLSFIANGCYNCVSNAFSSVINGCCNTANSSFSSILGGQLNRTCGFDNSHIIGSNISATRQDATFVNGLNIVDVPTLSTSGADLLVRESIGGEVRTVPSSNINKGFFAQTVDGVAVINTTAVTSLVGSGVGTLSVPANAFAVGDSYNARMGGNISTNSGSDTIRIRIGAFNGVSTVFLADSGVQTIPSLSNEVFDLEMNFTIRTIGGDGVAEIYTMGSMIFQKSSNGNIEGFEFNTLENSKFDTTDLNTLDITVEWGSASLGNSIQSRFFTLNKIF